MHTLCSPQLVLHHVSGRQVCAHRPAPVHLVSQYPYTRPTPAAAHLRRLVPQQPLVDLDLLLSRALDLAAAAHAVQVRPHARQAGQLVLGLRQLNLGPASRERPNRFGLSAKHTNLPSSSRGASSSSCTSTSHP